MQLLAQTYEAANFFVNVFISLHFAFYTLKKMFPYLPLALSLVVKISWSAHISSFVEAIRI